MLLYGKKVKQWIFSETIVVYDLKRATDDRSDKKFLLTSKRFSPGSCLTPAPELYTCIKSCFFFFFFTESDFKEIFFNWQQMGNLIRPFSVSVDIKILFPGGCLALPRGHIHV